MVIASKMLILLNVTLLLPTFLYDDDEEDHDYVFFFSGKIMYDGWALVA